MKKNTQNILDYLKITMSGLNLLMIIFLSAVSWYTILDINIHFQARRFLDSISYLPLAAGQNFKIAVFTYFILLMVIELREYVKKNMIISISLGVLEVYLCIIILYTQSICYTGILLLATVDIVRSLKDEKYQWIIFGFMSIIYIFSDYNIVSSQFKMISFEEYLFLADTKSKFMLLGIKNILSSFNLILFVLYMIILTRKQKEENEHIVYLNQELQLANEKLNIMNQQLQDYADMQYQLGEVTERNRIAREIHDTLGHTMTGLTVGLEACIRLVEISKESCKTQLKVLADVARDGLKDVRRSVNKLRPDTLEEQNLDDQIRKMIQNMESLHHIHIGYSMEKNHICQKEEEETIYRIVQESITNAIRHGKASNISIQIKEEKEWTLIQVQDDGLGCKNVQKGFGLIHMRERVEMLSGELSYDGSDGFVLIAKIPIRVGEEND